MDIEFGLTGLKEVNQSFSDELKRRQREAISVGGRGIRDDLRAMTRGPLGKRVARAWQLQIYGEDGSESPAAWVWTNAPEIISANMSAGVTRPRNGARFLAIPSEHVPKRRGYGFQSPMSPEEVEAYFNQELVFKKGRTPGTLVALVDAIQSRSKTRPGLRPATRRRKAQGRKASQALMFTFVPYVQRSKTISPERIFEKWRRRTKRLLEQG